MSDNNFLNYIAFAEYIGQREESFSLNSEAHRILENSQILEPEDLSSGDFTGSGGTGLSFAPSLSFSKEAEPRLIIDLERSLLIFIADVFRSSLGEIIYGMLLFSFRGNGKYYRKKGMIVGFRNTCPELTGLIASVHGYTDSLVVSFSRKFEMKNFVERFRKHNVKYPFCWTRLLLGGGVWIKN
ncbi:MAG: hypothetical protein G01um101418_854 [Parcubacteria group bacterium Gr01-1014_18]|nr:MAG: hypothetical protein Greene041636_814 [Parcubacteria group bacterium Greene0416_36]TSC79855.1 MAG: hypothetical protein G01um101418_854 [Parcubacteria group bacterium Gr01-1014_18]TSC98287.1 MAG: hypothetical protein Greene101420_791 [Parcubacteria group bacterium Greene1014_20]TSD06672.1 MAG: hypothetical protein Greene07142_724 [Parcubacteria group bacterium Greene0714_2]